MNVSQRLADMKLSLIALTGRADAADELTEAFGIYWPHCCVHATSHPEEVARLVGEHESGGASRSLACILVYLDHRNADEARRMLDRAPECSCREMPALIAVAGPTFDRDTHGDLIGRFDMAFTGPLLQQDIQRIVARVVRQRRLAH